MTKIMFEKTCCYHFGLILLFIYSAASEASWTCDRVQSLLRMEFTSDELFFDSHELTVEYQYTECRKCNLIPLARLTKDSSTNTFHAAHILDAHFDFYFKVVAINSQTGLETVVCDLFKYTKFDECGEYRLNITNDCSISVTREPNNIYIGLYMGIPLIILIILLFNLVEKYYEPVREKLNPLMYKSILFVYFTQIKISPREQLSPSRKDDENKDNSSYKRKQTSIKLRYRSMDTFRGLSKSLMIITLYLQDTYRLLSHVPWYGFSLATMVFPSSVWIMGACIPISLNAKLSDKKTTKVQMLVRIMFRTFKNFLVGLILNVDYDLNFKTLRIFGIMQRIGLCYFVLAVIELIFWKPIDHDKYKDTWKSYVYDLIYSIPHSITVSLILLIWCLIVYFLPVPGCPTGYLGPGGLEEGGRYFNCTGGATGYIDKLLLGENHLSNEPTQATLYKTVKNYDPEGLVGTLGSIVLGYFGVCAGRMFLFFDDKSIRFAVWSFVTFGLFGALTQFDMENGFMPVVRNVWTLPLTLISASTSFFIVNIFFVIIDIKSYWNGYPFVYMGCNSFFVYLCHLIFRYRFPLQWKTSDLCTIRMFMCIWATTLWTLVTAYLYHKRIFFKL